jgi:predicted RNA-binding protein associated with RNAse of E/G family
MMGETPNQALKITVHKLNNTGEEVIQYPGVVLEQKPEAIKIEASFSVDDVNVHGLDLRRGDRFIEWFFNLRWYNVFAIYDQHSGTLKGWYCNITRPAKIEKEDIYAEDLALDLIVFPKGDYIVLDQDEFERLCLSKQEREAATNALKDLISKITSFPSQFSAESSLE